MKNVKFNFKYALILLVSIAFFSCSKGDAGAIGPAGAQGEQGIQGQQGVAGQDGADGSDGTNGADGADGVDGEDGNANVIASAWIDADFATASSNFSFFDVRDSQFDATIINSGVVLVYGKEITMPNNDEFVHAIPYQNFNERYSFNITANVLNNLVLTAGRIRFTARSVDNSQEIFSRFAQFRYVIIPDASSASGKITTDFMSMTYEEVVQYFELDY